MLIITERDNMKKIMLVLLLVVSCGCFAMEYGDGDVYDSTITTTGGSISNS